MRILYTTLWIITKHIVCNLKPNDFLSLHGHSSFTGAFHPAVETALLETTFFLLLLLFRSFFVLFLALTDNARFSFPFACFTNISDAAASCGWLERNSVRWNKKTSKIPTITAGAQVTHNICSRVQEMYNACAGPSGLVNLSDLRATVTFSAMHCYRNQCFLKVFWVTETIFSLCFPTVS